MLTNTPPRHYSVDEDTDFIHNYYERRVLQELINTSSRAQQDREFLADVACVALNRLPPRYIRHDVDMTFFMSPQEMQEVEDKVTQAVIAALAYVDGREQDHRAHNDTGGNEPAVTGSNHSEIKKAPKKTASKKAKKSG